MLPYLFSFYLRNIPVMLFIQVDLGHKQCLVEHTLDFSIVIFDFVLVVLRLFLYLDG